MARIHRRGILWFFIEAVKFFRSRFVRRIALRIPNAARPICETFIPALSTGFDAKRYKKPCMNTNAMQGRNFPRCHPDWQTLSPPARSFSALYGAHPDGSSPPCSRVESRAARPAPCTKQSGLCLTNAARRFPIFAESLYRSEDKNASAEQLSFTVYILPVHFTKYRKIF